MTEAATLRELLDLARWAPSGDNTQPWRFEILGDDHVAVHGHDTRTHVLYDFDGHASHMAHGALLETLRIAATGFGLKASWTWREGTPDSAPIYDVRLVPDPAATASPLIPAIRKRSVQRRMMTSPSLSGHERQALLEAVGEGYSLRFFETRGERMRVARLLWDNAGLRLTCPEAYPVHRDVIEWNARFSLDRIPDQAVGVDPLTARLMQWVMQRWERVEFFNRYLGGTILPRVQLDLLPAIACSAHLLLVAETPPRELADYVRAGQAMQRLWLTVTSLGLQLQPEMTPVIFRWYARSGRAISRRPGIDEGARRLAERFEGIACAEPTTPFVFFCRIGGGAAPTARSLRKPLDDLMVA